MSNRRTGKHRIYMNVGYDLTEEQLRQFFSQYGHVTDVYLPKHKSGRNKGFGFTTFDSEESLQAALQAEEYLIGGEVVRINRAGPRPESELQRDSDDLDTPTPSTFSKQPDYGRQPQLFGKGPRLYVGGVPEELTEERLKAHFSRWGNVVDLYFPGKKGQSRVNYCFVTFDNWRAAQRACNQSERNIDGIVSPLRLCLHFRACIHNLVALTGYLYTVACCWPQWLAAGRSGVCGINFVSRHAHAQTLITRCCLLQVLQSINLAQERSAEQESAQNANSVPYVLALDPQPKPGVAAFGAQSFSMSPLAGSQPLPAFNLMQQLQLQTMQAQALQAQQLGVGLSAQQQQALPNMVPPVDPAQMSAFLAAYPAAYQQLLATMAATQGHRVTPSPLAPSSAIPLNPMVAAAGYSMPGVSPFQFPQAMPGLTSDISHLLAPGAQPGLAAPTAEQQAGPHQRVHSKAPQHRPDLALDPSRVPTLVMPNPDSLPGFSQAGTAPNPIGFPASSNPSMWGWGSAPIGDMFLGGPGTPMDVSLVAQSPFANSQMQSRPGSAPGPSLPMSGPQFGGKLLAISLSEMCECCWPEFLCELVAILRFVAAVHSEWCRLLLLHTREPCLLTPYLKELQQMCADQLPVVNYIQMTAGCCLSCVSILL